MDIPIETGPWIALAIEYVPRTVGALVFLFAAWIAAGWARRAVRRGLERADFDPTLTTFFAGLARWAILIMAILASLGLFGVQTTSFAALIGAAGLTAGLAFQGTLSNFSSGIMLLATRPFEVGDYISAAGVSGTAKELQLFYTILDTPGNERIFVPNNQIFGDVIQNFTYHDVRRVGVDVGAAYGAAIDDTRAVLERAATSVEGGLEDPAPQVFLKALGGSSVDWQVRLWARTPEYWDVHQRLARAIKAEMDAAGIGIPYSTMDVHLVSTPDGGATTTDDEARIPEGDPRVEGPGTGLGPEAGPD